MRAEKELLLDEIKQKIDASTAMIITRYDHLPPNTSWEFRNRLAKSGSLFEVVKKRVFVKAAEKMGIQVDESQLKGHIGVIFVGQPDPMPSTKVVFKFSEENGSLFEVLCGQMEGKTISGSELEALSKLPGINEMRATLLSVFTAPMSQILSVLEAVMAGPLSILKQKSEE